MFTNIMHNDVSAALEFLTDFNVFERTNMLRRTSDLNKRVANSGSGMILPKNPMLHMLDNFSHSDRTTDTFDLENYPFINSRNNIKYLNDFTDFSVVNKDDLDKFSHRIFRSKLAQILKVYSLAHRKIMVPAPKLDTVIENRNCIIVENYNPLYRIITTNARPISQYYRYRAILTTVLKNSMSYSRQHFLVIPVPDKFEYVRSNILSIIQSGAVSSPKLMSDSHFYFFILDLVALLLDNNSKLSTLNVIERRFLSAMNVILISKNKSIIFNIGKLATLAKTKTYVFGFVDNISRISGVNVPMTYIADADVDPGTADDETTEQPVLTTTEIASVQRNVSSIKSSTVSDILEEDPHDMYDIIPKRTDSQVVHVAATTVVNHEEAHEHEAPVVTPPVEEAPKMTEPKPVLSTKQQDRIAIIAAKHESIIVSTPKGPQTIKEILDEPVDIKLKPQHLNVQNADDIDPSMLHSSIEAFDAHYQTKLLRKDIITNIVSFSENGLYLTGYTETNDYTSFTRIKHIKATFVDAKGKRHTLNFKIPIPDQDGYYLVNGVRMSMSKQFVNIPICKISPTRVSLISNFNKTLVDKIESTRHSLPEVIASKADKIGLKVVPKHNLYIGINVPYDYKQLGGVYSKITSPTHEFYFEFKNRYDFFTPKLTQRGRPFASLEAQHGVLVGKVLESPVDCVFMSSNNVCTTVNIESGNIIESKYIVNYLGDLIIPAEWCNLKILDKNIPIIFILAYRYGLTPVLTNLKIKHRFVKKGTRETVLRYPTDLSIEFSEGWLVFDRYPLEHSYILAGFAQFPSLKRYPITDFDGKDIYYRLLSDKGMSTNYLKGIDNFFSFFIDPITKEVLQEMHEPTNTRDLLIRAVEMLVNNVDKEPSAISNFRVRSAEKIPATIYNEIARQYANYVNSNYKDVSFSINTEAIFQRIIQDETMTAREDLNPVHAVKEESRVTYTGFGGRSSEAFVARDRKYPKDAIGILSESTTDSGSVGMVASMTGNPRIKNLRGMFETEEEGVNTTNILSDVSLLMPCSTHDDQQM